MKSRLIAISGVGAKEPAAFVVEAAGHRLLLDCGEGPETGRLPNFDAIGHVDAIVLSHGHKDHAGALRFRDRIGMPPVFATAPVLARLKDATGSEIPICGTTDICGLSLQTGRNGHAPGGVWLRFAAGEGFLYMGDHSTESPLYAFDSPPPAATMVIDASYGEAEEGLEQQGRLIREIVSAGPVLLPAPPDGRAVEIAMFLQDSGFDVAIDDEVRSVAKMMTGAARASARPEAIPRLERLIDHAPKLDANAEPHGAMVAHGASGDIGVAGALIKRWEKAAKPVILFTGHLPSDSTGKRLVDEGRAQFQRWNVHPRFSDNLLLIERVAPKRILPAFTDGSRLPNWPARIAPRKLVSSTPIEL